MLFISRKQSQLLLQGSVEILNELLLRGQLQGREELLPYFTISYKAQLWWILISCYRESAFIKFQFNMKALKYFWYTIDIHYGFNFAKKW